MRTDALIACVPCVLRRARGVPVWMAGAARRLAQVLLLVPTGEHRFRCCTQAVQSGRRRPRLVHNTVRGGARASNRSVPALLSGSCLAAAHALGLDFARRTSSTRKPRRSGRAASGGQASRPTATHGTGPTSRPRTRTKRATSDSCTSNCSAQTHTHSTLVQNNGSQRALMQRVGRRGADPHARLQLR